MNSWEMSRRDEQRADNRRRGWILGKTLLVAVAACGIFLAGVRYGRGELKTDNATELSLNQNADSLRLVVAQLDSLRRRDSVASAAVVAHRPATARASAAVRVLADPRDSTVIVERPATVAGDSALPAVVDTLPALPLPVATFIREAKIQLALDSVALQVKDLRIAELEHANALYVERDSLHVQREHELEAERDAAWRRGLTKGVKIGIGVGVGTIALVKVLIR